MAITFDTATNGGNANANSLTFAHTCTGSNLFLVVSVFDSNDTVSGVTYAGVSMTKAWTSTGLGESFWYLIGPASGANNVVVTKSAGTASLGAVAASYAGCNQTAIDSKGSNTANQTTSPQTVNTTVVASNCWTIGYSSYNNGLGGTATTVDKTRRITQDWTGSGNAVGVLIADSNATVGTGAQGITYTRTGTVQNYQSNTLSISPSVAAGPANLKTYNTNVKANIKSIDTNLIANVKSLNTNT